MTTIFILVAISMIFAYLCLRLLESWTQDPYEPPLINTGIPYIGSIIKMMRYKTEFYQIMQSEQGLAIYTLRIPGSRLYVVNSLPLISAIQKQHRTLSWAPLMGAAIQWITGTSEYVNNMMAYDIVTEHGFLLGINKATNSALAPGSSLDAMNTLAINTFSISIDTMVAKRSCQFSLLQWVRTQIILATTDAIYGIHSPFRDHDVREAWDNYRPGIPNLGPKALPSFMASKSIRAREHVVKALMHFFQAGYHKKGSELLMARYKYIVEKHQVKDLYDLARLELAGAFASIENMVPTAFWFFYRLYSDPVVLKECRDEVSHIVEERNGACYIDVDSIKSSCPILQSTLHETIRYHSTTISARKVTEDYVLDQYVLKKGSTILIPASVPHFNEGSWGTNAGRFDYTRFILDHDGHTKKGARRTAFRGFGGGYHLCPGRHFAVTEMLSLASMVVLRFDITPVDTIWAALENANLSFNGTAAPVPDKEFPVIFVPRDNRKWVFFVSGKGSQMDLLATE